MYKYVVEKSAVNYQWKYKRMLPFLPVPGSEAFALLCKQLHPFGMTPEHVTIDGSSSRMSELSVGVALLENRMIIRLNPGGIDVLIAEMFESDESSIVEIVTYLFEAVSKIDGDAINGEAEVRTSLHLRLLGVDVVDYLSKLLVGTEISSKLVPVTTVFQIDKTTGMKADSIRVLVAKSLVYDSAIFIDMNSTYSGPIDVPTFANWINDDFSKSANLLQLSE